MLHGILLINKPKGKTSFYLVGRLRKIFQEKKIGHAGTLDPFATGVMILLIGKPFTKLSDQFLNKEKSYIATAFLGKSTDTFDEDGQITNESSVIPTNEEVAQVIAKFQGKMMQIPPMFSAKKVDGKKLYELARKGITIEREPVEVDLQVTLLSYEYPKLTFKVLSSKGTYIRSIADDMGKELGTYAHLIALERILSGSFQLNNCLDWQRFEESGCDISSFTTKEDGLIHFPDHLRSQ